MDLSAPPKLPPRLKFKLGGIIILGFLILSPILTFFLFLVKGLPDFARARLLLVLGWVFQTTWLAALVAGVLIAAIVLATVQRTPIFIYPYDFGRCFSLGAIVGGIAEALGTYVQFFLLFHSAPSGFRLAGDIMSGCVAGAVVAAGAMGLLSLELNKGRVG